MFGRSATREFPAWAVGNLEGDDESGLVSRFGAREATGCA